MPKFDLILRGYVGDYAFDPEYVCYMLGRYDGQPVNVLIESLGGDTYAAFSIAAAFRRHGNVTVHYCGANASAATVAGMGAAKITIDDNALFLVHNAMYYIPGDLMNVHDIFDHIEHLDKMREDLKKVDASIMLLYAGKCGKKPEDFAPLMKEDKWLTASEAKEWGFVDEVISTASKPKPMPKSVAYAIKEQGLPLPPGVINPEAKISDIIKSTVITVLERAGLTSTIKNKNTMEETQTPESVAEETPATTAEEQAPTTEEQLEAANARIAALEAANAELQQQIDAIEASAPGEETTAVVETKNVKNETPLQPVEAFAQNVVEARKIFDSLP